MAENKILLEAVDLSIGYGKKSLFEYIGLQLNRGEVVSLLGPNGVGKSTFLRTLCGFQPAISGQVLIGNRQLHQLSPKQRAMEISVVLTEQQGISHLKVAEVVALGRHPYTNWIGELSADDKIKIASAISAAGLDGFENRKVDELSDGERQKVMIARALAQDTPIILLDEPTNHLDLSNKVEIFRLIKNLAANEGKTFLLATHEIEMAVHAADKLVLMSRDKKSIACGRVDELILSGDLQNTFSTKYVEFDKITMGFKYRF